MQKCSTSIANASELLLSCIKPSIYKTESTTICNLMVSWSRDRHLVELSWPVCDAAHEVMLTWPLVPSAWLMGGGIMFGVHKNSFMVVCSIGAISTVWRYSQFVLNRHKRHSLAYCQLPDSFFIQISRVAKIIYISKSSVHIIYPTSMI